MLPMSVQYDAQFYIATMLRPWYSCAATPISQSDISGNYCNAQVAGGQQCSKKCFRSHFKAWPSASSKTALAL